MKELHKLIALCQTMANNNVCKLSMKMKYAFYNNNSNAAKGPQKIKLHKMKQRT